MERNILCAFYHGPPLYMFYSQQEFIHISIIQTALYISMNEHNIQCTLGQKRQNIDMRYEGSEAYTAAAALCYQNLCNKRTSGVTTIIFPFLPFFSQSEERFQLLHIFYIACYINKKEFITEDMYSVVHISVFISTTIATTRALIRVNET